MRRTLQHRKSGLQTQIIEKGGNLTDSAAEPQLHSASIDHRCFHKAILFGPFSDPVIIGEAFPGWNDSPV